MNLTAEIKDRILESIDLVDLISESVELKRKGSNYVGLCPFHNEKTPSFTVSPSKSIYKCFGCGASGNAITFMMDFHGMSFPEAVKELARRAGIQIDDKPLSPLAKEKLDRREAALKALKIAADFYAKTLDSTAGKIASAYLSKRGLDAKTVSDFNIGYAPDKWDALLSELAKRDVPEKAAADAGLIIEKENGKRFDRFRNRIVFPIKDRFGNVVGFGARALDKNAPAKYVNSPQTIVYDKSAALYGLFEAKDEIRAKGYAILTEGYFDVLSLHKAGFKNAVASSGTSLTRGQLELLSRYCSKIHIAYDGDEAGQKAAVRAIDLAVEKSFDVYVVESPYGEDPDSVINEIGASSFQSYLDSAKHFFVYLIDLKKKSIDPKNPFEKSSAIRELISLVAKIPDRMQHDDYLTILSDAFALTQNQIESAYREKLKIEAQNKGKTFNLTRNYVPPKNDAARELRPRDKIGLDVSIEKELTPEEKLIVKLLATNSEILAFAEKIGFDPQMLRGEKARKLASFLLGIRSQKGGFAAAIEESQTLAEEEKRYLTDLVFVEETPSEKWDEFTNKPLSVDHKKAFADAFKKNAVRKIDENVREILERIKTETDIEKIIDLQKKQKALIDKKNSILNSKRDYEF